ncbi:MAG: chloride channel protein [Hyphomicrobiaceae bacterium]
MTDEAGRSEGAPGDGSAPPPVTQRARRIVERAQIWLGEMIRVILDRLHQNLSDFFADRQLLVWALAITIGIGVAYAAIAFRFLLGAFQWLWLGTSSEKMLAVADATPWPVILLAPAVGGLIVGYILVRFIPGRRPLGVADVIESRALGNCKIPTKDGLWSALTATIALGFGGSAGREGPVVHLGATLASWLEDRFSLSSSARRKLLACGVAAAVSASFNAPIAGVLFAHEVILAHYALRAFVPIVMASVAGAVISRLHYGNFAAFVVPEYQISSYLEFPAFALLGVTCALVVVLFELSIMTTERVAWRIKMPLWLRPAIGGLLVGAIAVFFPQVLGVGYDATDKALNNQWPLTILILLIVAKTAATAITFASRLAVGVFSPALYLGAMTGGAFGLIASAAFPEMSSSNGLYALLGMGGVAAAVLGAPISTTLIVFELTGGYEMTIALLLTVCISHGLSQAALGHSYFHWQLSKRGLSLQEGPHKEIMRRLTVANFMTVREAGDVLPVDLCDIEKAWLVPDDTLERALRAFDNAGAARIPVVSASNQTGVIGWADRMTALSAYNRALVEAHEEEHL